jgi:nitrogen fixation/metabolism regulation signal transduction histidine kinase
MIGAGGLIVLGLGLVLGRTIVFHITNPINRVAAAAQDIAAGNLDRRIGMRRGDEVGELADSFDLMASRVQHLVEAQEASLRQIQRQQDVLRAVMDAVPVGIIMIGLDGTIRLVNHSVDDLLNSDSSRLIGLDPVAAITALQADPPDQTALIGAISANAPGSDLASVTIYEVTEPELRTFEIHAAPVIAESGERLGRIFTPDEDRVCLDGFARAAYSVDVDQRLRRSPARG